MSRVLASCGYSSNWKVTCSSHSSISEYLYTQILLLLAIYKLQVYFPNTWFPFRLYPVSLLSAEVQPGRSWQTHQILSGAGCPDAQQKQVRRIQEASRSHTGTRAQMFFLKHAEKHTQADLQIHNADWNARGSSVLLQITDN